ncbi:unnamed protein product [Paramecium sonneborni]|uniref:Uncharacterized protein n=1 Tax=Paramecium sonneborni TaxID=65129 RepID=A0A8S1NBW8_9CILI|nr:unnamed protein product [Paramecium sonneborni]
MTDQSESEYNQLQTQVFKLCHSFSLDLFRGAEIYIQKKILNSFTMLKWTVIQYQYKIIVPINYCVHKSSEQILPFTNQNPTTPSSTHKFVLLIQIKQSLIQKHKFHQFEADFHFLHSFLIQGDRVFCNIFLRSIITSFNLLIYHLLNFQNQVNSIIYKLILQTLSTHCFALLSNHL